CQQGNTNPPTF
nr:immunoglobulin light chain junction region [Macaca mulatta]